MADFGDDKRQIPEIGTVYNRSCRDLGAVITLTDAGAGTTLSADLFNTSSRGVLVTIDITAKTGTIDLVVTVQRKDKASGKYIDLLSSASLTDTGTTVLKVTPDIAAVANASAVDFIGEIFRVKAVSGTGATPAITATIGACLVP